MRSGDGPGARGDGAVDAAVHGDGEVDGGTVVVEVKVSLIVLQVWEGMGVCVYYLLTLDR